MPFYKTKNYNSVLTMAFGELKNAKGPPENSINHTINNDQ